MIGGADVLELLRKFDRQGLIWFLTIFGYPFFVFVALVLSLQTHHTTYLFRIIVIVLCISEVKSFGIFSILNSIPISVRIFALAYLCRLTYDAIFISFSPIFFNSIYLIAVVILPVLAICRFKIISKLEDWSEIFAFSGGLLCLILLIIFLLGIADLQSTTLRMGRLSYVSLNPISIGSLGAITMLAAFLMYLKQTERNRIVIIAIGFLGYIVVALSVSRGPALSMGIVFFVLNYISFGLRKVHIGVLLFALMCFTPFFSSQMVGNNLPDQFHGTLRYSQQLNTPIPDNPVQEVDIKQRLHDFILDESGSERITLIREALNQFMLSPVFGYRSFLISSANYPHNIFIETLLALGIIGLILLLWILYHGIMAANIAIKNKIFLVPSLFYFSFFLSQFSGAIWNSSIFWVTLICLMSRPSHLLDSKAIKSSTIKSV